MVKQRKTREEKIAAAQKREQQPQFQYSLSSLQTNIPANADAKIVTVSQDYVKKDLQKTFLISCILIAAEVALYILLTQHIIKLPWNLY